MARSTEGWVPEDDIFSELHEYHGITDTEILFAMSIGIVVEILQTGLMYPVFYDDKPWQREFTTLDSWDGDVWTAIQKIDRQWREVIANPGFSDVVWFGPTSRGYERGLRVLRREGWEV